MNMKLIKKIAPLAVLGLSVLMLVLSVIDIFSSTLQLFDRWYVILASVVLLLGSLGLTLISCLEPTMRRPLVLLGCLLHTPIGGGLILLYVYGMAFPDALPMAMVMPFAMLLFTVASAVQAGIFYLCNALYEEEIAPDSEGEEDEGDDERAEAVESAPEAAPEAAPETAPEAAPEAAPEPAPESAPEVAPESAPESAPEAAPESAPEAAPEPAPEPAPEAVPEPAPETVRIRPVAVPRQPVQVEVTREDEDDLAPIPKRKSKKQPAFETGMKTAAPVVPKMAPAPVSAPAPKAEKPAPKVEKTEQAAPARSVTPEKKAAPETEKAPKKAYTDPFGLLTEEVKAEEKSSVKSIFGEDET